MEPYDKKMEENESWLHFLFVGPLQSYSLPAMTLESLGTRLGIDSMTWKSWFRGGGMMTLLSIWSIMAPNYFAEISPTWVFVALVLYYGPLVGVLMVFVWYTDGDREWTDIDDFLEHRVVRWNKKNATAMFTQFVSLLQLTALTVRVLPDPEKMFALAEEPSSYSQFKVSAKRFFDMALFQFDIIDTPEIEVDFFLVAVYLSVGAVVLWWILFGGLLLRLTMSVSDNKSAIQSRFQLYQKLQQGGSTFYYVYTVLSDQLSISILSNLMKTMDCTVDADGIPTLDANGWVCWGYSSTVRAEEAARCAADCVATAGNTSQCFNLTSGSVTLRPISNPLQTYLRSTVWLLVVAIWYLFNAEVIDAHVFLTG